MARPPPGKGRTPSRAARRSLGTSVVSPAPYTACGRRIVARVADRCTTRSEASFDGPYELNHRYSPVASVVFVAIEGFDRSYTDDDDTWMKFPLPSSRAA